MWNLNVSRGASLALVFALGLGCQKKDSASCGTSVAGDTSLENGGADSLTGGSGGAAVSAGGSSSGASFGGDGTAAAAATGGNTALGGTGGAAPDSTACSAIAVANCAATMNCQVLSGQQISVDPACVLSSTGVACGTALGCTSTATRATDPQGHDWVFPSTCLPAGWVNASTSGTRFDACAGNAGGSSGSGGAGGANGGTGGVNGGSGGSGG